jgi:hypothetical protein
MKAKPRQRLKTSDIIEQALTAANKKRINKNLWIFNLLTKVNTFTSITGE